MLISRHANLPSRRNAMFWVAESLSVLPLTWLGFKSITRHDSYAAYDLSKAALPEGKHRNMSRDLGAVASATASGATAVEQVNDIYRATYRKSRSETYFTYTNKRFQSHTRIVHYWDVPRGMIEKELIESWQKQSNILNEKISSIESKKFVDIDKLNQIAIKSLDGHTGSREFLAGMVYAGELLLLLSYEELIASVQSVRRGTKYREALEHALTPHQHSRRGVLKIGASFAGLAAAFSIERRVNQRLESGKARLDAAVAESQKESKRSDDTVISEYLGSSITENIVVLNQRVAEIRALSRRGIADPQVSSAFQQLCANDEQLSAALQSIASSPDRKRTFAKLCASRMVTDKLEEAETAEKRVAAFRIIPEALGISLAMAAVIIPGEVLNKFVGSAAVNPSPIPR